MRRRRFAIPFGAGLLCLLAVILLPLVGTLLGIGWYTASQLEEAVLAARTRTLETSIATLANQGFQRVSNTQQALADAGVFADRARVLTEGETPARLVLQRMLARHQNMVAGYVGYADGSFLYVARVDLLAPARRAEIGAPSTASTALRVIRADGSERRDAWTFFDDEGAELPGAPALPQDYDPRTRGWFRDAAQSGRTILTEPYAFAGAGGIGLTVATPLPGTGVIGADLTLIGFSRLLHAQKVTPSSVILLATESGAVVARTDIDAQTTDSKILTDLMLADIRRLAEGESRFIVARRRMDGSEFRIEARPLPPVHGRQLYIAVAAPVVELAAETEGLILRSGLVAAVAVLLALGAGAVAARLMSGPLARIARKTNQFRHMDFSDSTRVDSRLREIGHLDDAVEHMRSGLEQFGRYVPRQLVRQVIESPAGAAIGGARQPVTVLISDIAGFSHTAESTEPEQLVGRLSRYLESLGGIVMQHGGTIDKYIGDSIMALWNAPVEDSDHVARACRAALAMSVASEHLENKWIGRGRPPFRTRCGLHTGHAIVGNIGSLDRMNYTVVGTVPNVASRIEALNKVYGTRVLASGDVAAAAAGAFFWRTIDSVVPAGMSVAIDLCEPIIPEIPAGSDSDAAAEAFVARWHDALAAYRQGHMRTALEAFRALAGDHPDDGPCRTFVDRCERYLDYGVPRGWSGVTTFQEK